MKFIHPFTALWLFILPFLLQAQNKDGAIHVPDTLNTPYVKISGVEVTGNKITKPAIIIRELDFKTGDSLATFQKGSKVNFSDRNFYPGDSSELLNAPNFVAFGYKIPWIGKGKKIGLTLGAGYQNMYNVEYASVDNKRQMLYANNSSEDFKISAKLSLRPGLYNYGTIKLTGEYIRISDSVFKLDSNYLAGHKKENASLSLYADYYYDSRNSHSYPLKGNMLRVFINKVGLGLVSKDIDLFYYGIDFHFYQTLGRKWYIAEMVKAENQTGENAPYYYQLNMTQGKDFIRRFDLYTLKGDQMYYCRNNIKYELVKPSVKKVKEGQEKNKFKAIQYAFTSINTNGFFFGFGMPI